MLGRGAEGDRVHDSSKFRIDTSTHIRNCQIRQGSDLKFRNETIGPAPFPGGCGVDLTSGIGEVFGSFELCYGPIISILV